MHYKKIVYSLLLLSFSFFLCACKEQIAQVGVATKAPTLAVFDAQQHPIILDDYEGKAVIVEFWSVACGSCLAMMAELEKVAVARPDDVAVLGINIDKKEFNLNGFAEKKGFSFPLGLDQLGITQERYQVTVTPTTFFLNRRGEIVQKHVGFSEEMDLDDYVDNLY